MKYTLLIALTSWGCAYAPSQELVTARNAYDAAAQSQAASVTPAELHEAKVALDKAELADRDDQGSDRARDQAYIAVRKAEWAQAKAATAQAIQQQQSAEKRYAEIQTEQLSSARGQLQTHDLREAQALAQRAERREKEALAKLAVAEKVSSDARGQVITLSSALLFKSNQSVLLPGAHARLDDVVMALKQIPEREFLIEGHTDATGGEQKNLALSERRAKAVKDYMVAKGVDESRIKTTGAGKSRPIAGNKSAEGRAMNRRVEIVVLKSDSETATK